MCVCVEAMAGAKKLFDLTVAQKGNQDRFAR